MKETHLIEAFADVWASASDHELWFINKILQALADRLSILDPQFNKELFAKSVISRVKSLKGLS